MNTRKLNKYQIEICYKSIPYMFKSKFVTDLKHIEIEFYGDKFSIDKKISKDNDEIL